MRRRLLVIIVIGLSAWPVAVRAEASASASTTISWRPSYAVSVDPGVAQFSPDGTLLIVHGVEIWRVGRWRLVHTLNMPTADSRPHGRFSPDGTKVVTFGLGPADPRIWDTKTRRPLHVLRGHTGGPGVDDHSGWTTTATFSPDGSRVITAGWDRTARIWDVASGRSLLVMRGHSDTVETAVFGPDGTRVATAGDDATVRIWDARTGRCLRVLRGGTSVFFSPDGRRLFTSSPSATTIWNAATGRRLQILSGQAWTISPDGNLLPLVSHGQTRIFDIATGVVLRTVRGIALSFNPDGRHLATYTGWDKQHHPTVGIWNTATGALLHTVRSGAQWEMIDTATFSPNGRYLLTSENRIDEVLAWNVATGRLAKGFG